VLNIRLFCEGMLQLDHQGVVRGPSVPTNCVELADCGTGRRVAIAPGPETGTFLTVALSAWTVRAPVIDRRDPGRGASSRSTFRFQTSLYSISKS
jgi:hypothetical protein